MATKPMHPFGSGDSQLPQIEQKNLGIIEDQMYHEALAYKKCCLFSEWFTDQALKDMSNCAAQHHRQHFNVLYDYLNNHK